MAEGQAYRSARVRHRPHALLTNVHGIDLSNWKAALAEAKEPFNLGRLIRLVKEYHLLNPVIVDCTSSRGGRSVRGIPRRRFPRGHAK